MGINERILNLLSLGSVDDIIIDAPYFIEDSFLKDFNIQKVVEGSLSNLDYRLGDPFEVPKKLGKFEKIESTNLFTTNGLIERVCENLDTIKNAIERKKYKQKEYYEKEDQKVNKMMDI